VEEQAWVQEPVCWEQVDSQDGLLPELAWLEQVGKAGSLRAGVEQPVGPVLMDAPRAAPVQASLRAWSARLCSRQAGWELQARAWLPVQDAGYSSQTVVAWQLLAALQA
jgi:hypothetical protein